MQSVRERIYNQLEQHESYSIEELAQQYRMSEDTIRIHLDRLSEEGKKLKITDKEVSILLEHNHSFWIFAFWIFVGFIITLLFSGVING